MALLSSVYLFFLGIASVAWAVSSKAEDAELKGWGSTIVGFYCMALAVAIVLFEWKFGMQVPLLQVRQRLVGRGAREVADDALTRVSPTVCALGVWRGRTRGCLCVASARLPHPSSSFSRARPSLRPCAW